MLKPTTELYKFSKNWYVGPQHVPYGRVDSNHHISRECKSI
jgi:hypothetical protein